MQFIFITHNKSTMELASQLIGVTMNEPGVSRLVAVDVDEAVRLAAVLRGGDVHDVTVALVAADSRGWCSSPRCLVGVAPPAAGARCRAPGRVRRRAKPAAEVSAPRAARESPLQLPEIHARASLPPATCRCASSSAIPRSCRC